MREEEREGKRRRARTCSRVCVVGEGVCVVSTGVCVVNAGGRLVICEEKARIHKLTHTNAAYNFTHDINTYTLQHNASHYSTMQHTATHCNTMQHNATHPQPNTHKHTTQIHAVTQTHTHTRTRTHSETRVTC